MRDKRFSVRRRLTSPPPPRSRRLSPPYIPPATSLLWNAGHPLWKPIEVDVEESMNTNVRAAFAFARHASDEVTGKGTLIFTGATARLVLRRVACSALSKRLWTEGGYSRKAS
ncbi:hypothetical protein BDZ89DRAFT_536553 [Hymenopellis radicata]|nr:hypothetical protein BDZ89DRAFT_536553 [Hymenopellis radicata]